MDGLQVGDRKVRVSMAKPSSLEKYYEKVGQKDSRPPAAIALQVGQPINMRRHPATQLLENLKILEAAFLRYLAL